MKNQNTRRFFLDKLIRDNVVEHLEKKGVKVTYYAIKDSDEFLGALGEKVVEELNEVFEAETKEQVIAELADLDDVLHRFKLAVGIDQAVIDKARAEKVARNGGFDKRLFCEFIDVKEGTPEFDYFLAKEEAKEASFEEGEDEFEDDECCDDE